MRTLSLSSYTIGCRHKSIKLAVQVLYHWVEEILRLSERPFGTEWVPQRPNYGATVEKKKERLTQVGDAYQKIRDHEGCSTIQAICSFLDECSAILEKSGNVRHSHEGHERGAEELAVVSAGILPLPLGTTHNGVSERSDR